MSDEAISSAPTVIILSAGSRWETGMTDLASRAREEAGNVGQVPSLVH
jgi:hypothetical protein